MNHKLHPFKKGFLRDHTFVVLKQRRNGSFISAAFIIHIYEFFAVGVLRNAFVWYQKSVGVFAAENLRLYAVALSY